MFRTHSYANISIYSLKVHFSFHHAQFNTNTILRPTHPHTDIHICEFSVSFHLSFAYAWVSSPMYRDYTLWDGTHECSLATFYIYIPPPQSRCLCVCKIDVYIRFVCMPFLYSQFCHCSCSFHTHAFFHSFGLTPTLGLYVPWVFFRV